MLFRYFAWLLLLLPFIACQNSDQTETGMEISAGETEIVPEESEADQSSTQGSQENEDPDVTTTDSSVIDDEDSDSLHSFTIIDTFEHSMDLWDFSGKLSKFNLSHLQNSQVPDIEASEDHVAIIFDVTPGVSLLRKLIMRPLQNVSLSITHFLKFTDIFLTGMTVNSVEDKQEIFLNGDKDHWMERNHFWITETFDLGSHNSSFEVIFKVKTSTSALWAIESISIRGFGKEKHTKVHCDVLPAVVVPEWAHNGDNSTTEPEEQSEEEDPEKVTELSSIATSLWQVLYVFIAIFLAVVVLFAVLFVKQKGRKLEIEAVPGTYEHRPSMPRPRPENNLGYQSDPV